MNPKDLPQTWREQAKHLRQLGAEGQACTLEWCAEELEAAWRAWELEELTIAQAAAESGYSEDHLRELVREEKIPARRRNGSQGEILIRRCDSPRKPGAQRQTLGVVEDRASQLLAVRR